MTLDRHPARHRAARRMAGGLALAGLLTLAACGGGSKGDTTPTTTGSTTSSLVASPAASAASTTAATQTTSGSATASTSGTPSVAVTATTAPQVAGGAAPTAPSTGTGSTATQPAGTQGAAAQPAAESTATATAPTPAPVSTSPSAKGDRVGQQSVDQMADAWKKVTSYRMIAVLSGADGGEDQGKVTMDYVAPDKQHVTISQAGQTAEWIMVGKTTYMNVAGTWVTLSKEESEQSPANFDASSVLGPVIGLGGSDISLARAGEGEIDGVRCDIVTAAVTGDEGEVTYWVGQQDHLVRKIETKTSSGTIVTTLSDFNGSFSIKPPV